MRLLTTDIYEGAYFMSQGMHLEQLWLNGKNGNSGKRNVVFEFGGSQVELLRKDYQKGKAEANVVKLKQSLNLLKDRMFNLMRTEVPEFNGVKRRREYDTKQYVSEQQSCPSIN